MSTVTIKRPSELVQGSVKLSSPPLIYNRLMEVINHPRGGAGDVANVVREDPALTARLLKIVNSAFFSFPQRIDTVSQAVTVVGTSQIRDLALATSVVEMFEDVPPDLVDMESFWRHSLACGSAARTLAGLRREGNVERFFVAGILHDLGKLVIYLKCPDEARKAMEEAAATNTLLHQAERNVLGFDHTQVGEALLDVWTMPMSLREAVHYHHNPRRASRYPVETAAVHVADVMANALEFGNAGERFVPPISPDAWDALGIDAALIPSSIEKMERNYRSAVQLIAFEAEA